MEKTSIEFPRLPEILTEVEEEILHLLLKNPLLNKYEVGEKLGKSYSNIYNAIKTLIAKGMVEVANVRAGKRNQNIRVECYRATERGARHVLESVQIK
ncbi:MAG: helix-turn-helix domain-containing protein, partial [Candidatus Bathyarchaeia archaeon]